MFNDVIFLCLGVGGHGGTGIHADRKDKYREIIQRLSLHASPDQFRCNETEKDGDSKKSHLIDQDLLSSNYSTLEFGDRYSTTSSINSLLQGEFQTIRRLNQHAIQDRELPDSYRPITNANVQRCRICTIL